MLEPLFRCNLACAGCGKIDYPSEILNKRLSLKECLDSVDELVGSQDSNKMSWLPTIIYCFTPLFRRGSNHISLAASNEKKLTYFLLSKVSPKLMIVLILCLSMKGSTVSV